MQALILIALIAINVTAIFSAVVTDNWVPLVIPFVTYLVLRNA